MRRLTGRLIIRLSIFFLLAGARAEDAAGTGGKTLVLNESASFRQHLQFGFERIDAKALQTEGEKILDAARIAELKRCFPPDANGVWPDNILSWGLVNTSQSGDWRPSLAGVGAPAPAGWPAADFDDASWLNQRYPFLLGWKAVAPPYPYTQIFGRFPVRRACHRAYFQIPDPAQAGDYSLGLSYIGGARVFVNGKEIARQHLPEGDLAADAAAASYPQEAYVLLAGECPAEQWDFIKSKQSPPFCPMLRGKYEDYPPAKKGAGDWGEFKYYGSSFFLNRAAWDRLSKLRHRTLGPLVIPKSALCKGANVLAIEVVASRVHPIVLAGAEQRWPPIAKAGVFQWGTGIRASVEFYWPHAQLLSVALEASKAGTPPAIRRPAGMQAWVEDPHRRVFSEDFSSATVPGTIRFVCAQNGTFSAQVAVASDMELKGLSATAGVLTAVAGGSTLPATALRAASMTPHRLSELARQGRGFSRGESFGPLDADATEIALARYSPSYKDVFPARETRLKEVENLFFFDHIGGTFPPGAPGGSTLPLWLSLAIPRDAQPGLYKGSLTIQAEGQQKIAIPIEADVLGWKLPDAKDFRTVAALEQSPYGVAKHYGAALWSDAHFKLLEASCRQLARTGNFKVFVPVLQNMEFGNRKDTPISWTLKADGSWSFNYKNLDRYLDAAAQCGWPPRVICFAVMHGSKVSPRALEYLDEKSGKTETLDLSLQAPNAAAHWKAFATALHQHMKARNADKQMLWGYCWDEVSEPELIKLLAEAAPGVRWAQGSHGRGCDKDFFLASTIHDGGSFYDSLMGWRKTDGIRLITYRELCGILKVEGVSQPYLFRLMAERALMSGYRGFGRYGLDYWGNVYLDGAKVNWPPGMPCHALLWPGPNGAEPSARFECMLEGIQETEARIFLEEQVVNKKVPEELAKRITETLKQNALENFYINPAARLEFLGEYCTGWQERSRKLYAIAAEAARAVEVPRP